jgi:hypothetical protein
MADMLAKPESNAPLMDLVSGIQKNVDWQWMRGSVPSTTQNPWLGNDANETKQQQQRQHQKKKREAPSQDDTLNAASRLKRK